MINNPSSLTRVQIVVLGFVKLEEDYTKYAFNNTLEFLFAFVVAVLFDFKFTHASHRYARLTTTLLLQVTIEHVKFLLCACALNAEIDALHLIEFS